MPSYTDKPNLTVNKANKWSKSNINTNVNTSTTNSRPESKISIPVDTQAQI